VPGRAGMHEHLRSLDREQPCDRLPDPGAGAGHDRGLSIQPQLAPPREETAAEEVGSRR